MNDRFKFRVWNKSLEKYVNNINISPFGLLVFIGSEFCFIDNNYVVEQCTGLKDKKGNLIYEGDIVKIPDDWSEYGMSAGSEKEVYFYDGGFRFKPEPDAFERGCRGHWMEDVDGVLEIIGNIHKQAEQLKHLELLVNNVFK